MWREPHTHTHTHTWWRERGQEGEKKSLSFCYRSLWACAKYCNTCLIYFSLFITIIIVIMWTDPITEGVLFIFNNLSFIRFPVALFDSTFKFLLGCSYFSKETRKVNTESKKKIVTTGRGPKPNSQPLMLRLLLIWNSRAAKLYLDQYNAHRQPADRLGTLRESYMYHHWWCQISASMNNAPLFVLVATVRMVPYSSVTRPTQNNVAEIRITNKRPRATWWPFSHAIHSTYMSIWMEWFGLSSTRKVVAVVESWTSYLWRMNHVSRNKGGASREHHMHTHSHNFIRQWWRVRSVRRRACRSLSLTFGTSHTLPVLHTNKMYVTHTHTHTE